MDIKGDLKTIQENFPLSSSPRYIKKLTGGDINEVFLIESDKKYFVVKKNESNEFPEMLAKEFRALAFFNQYSDSNFPRPRRYFTIDGYQYLLMEYFIEGENTSKGQRELGRQLAKQHELTAEDFGWEEDNYIGSLPQINTKRKTWQEFYAVNRLLAQSKMAFNNNFVGVPFINKTERFCAKIDEVFPIEPPSLLHGDLWGGNYMITEKEEPLFFDPAIYYGHREIDIAMTRLFGGFSNDFYDSYREHNPLEPGWEERVKYGQLYPNLVHLNLFGPAYLESVSTVINKF